MQQHWTRARRPLGTVLVVAACLLGAVLVPAQAFAVAPAGPVAQPVPVPAPAFPEAPAPTPAAPAEPGADPPAGSAAPALPPDPTDDIRGEVAPPTVGGASSSIARGPESAVAASAADPDGLPVRDEPPVRSAPHPVSDRNGAGDGRMGLLPLTGGDARPLALFALVLLAAGTLLLHVGRQDV